MINRVSEMQDANAPQQVSFQNQFVSCIMNIAQDRRSLKIQGSVANPSQYARIEIIASNAADRMTNYSGSGLPFPCAGMAFDGTPNHIEIDPASSGSFAGVFSYPNSFYSQDAFDKITSSVFVRLMPKNVESEPIFVRMQLPEVTPLQVRTLTHRPNREKIGPTFYSAKADIIGVRSAYDTMVSLKNMKLTYELA